MKRKWNKSEINTKKYLYPPKWTEIQSFIDELNVSYNRFENFYGIPFNTLTQIKSGARKLPSAYWDIVYEKIKPNYGSGFLYQQGDDPPSLTTKLTNNIPKRIPHEMDAHYRLTTVK